MIASIAQGVHLSHQEREHLYRLAVHTPPRRGGAREEHIAPGLLVYTAVPGSESYEKLQLLSVIGHAIA